MNSLYLVGHHAPSRITQRARYSCPLLLSTVYTTGGDCNFVVLLEFGVAGAPLLLIELATLLTNVGTEVHWVTNQKYDGRNSGFTHVLETRLKDNKVKVRFSSTSEI